jgi:hypothetical protein
VPLAPKDYPPVASSERNRPRPQREDAFKSDLSAAMMTPHIVSNRGAEQQIALKRRRVLGRALQFNDNPRTIVATITAGLRVTL